VRLVVYNLLMQKPEEQFLSTGIDFAFLGVQPVQRGGRWPGTQPRLQDGASLERVASCVHGAGTVLFNMATNPAAAGLAPPVIVAVDRLLDVECMYSTGWAAGDEGKGYDQHGDESESYDGVFSWQ